MFVNFLHGGCEGLKQEETCSISVAEQQVPKIKALNLQSKRNSTEREVLSEERGHTGTERGRLGQLCAADADGVESSELCSIWTAGGAAHTGECRQVG